MKTNQEITTVSAVSSRVRRGEVRSNKDINDSEASDLCTRQGEDPPHLASAAMPPITSPSSSSASALSFQPCDLTLECGFEKVEDGGRFRENSMRLGKVIISLLPSLNSVRGLAITKQDLLLNTMCTVRKKVSVILYFTRNRSLSQKNRHRRATRLRLRMILTVGF